MSGAGRDAAGTAGEDGGAPKCGDHFVARLRERNIAIVRLFVIVLLSALVAL